MMNVSVCIKLTQYRMKSALYLRTRCFCIRNLTPSLRPLVRFLIRQQLVRRIRTPALSMKYSLYINSCKYFFS